MSDTRLISTAANKKPVCTECSAPVSDRCRTGRCRTCAARRMGKARKVPRARCLDCDKELRAVISKSGRCGPCGNRFRGSDPAFQAKRAEGIRRKFRDDPLHRARMTAVVRRNGAKARENPEFVAWLSNRGKELSSGILRQPEIRARNIAAIRANSHKITEARIGWCPPEYRVHYRSLTASGIRAPEARRLIEDEIATAERRMSPFERQMLAVERGAKLVPNFKIKRAMGE